MVFTDPPYGVSIGSKNEMLNSIQPSGRCTQNIENDTLRADEQLGRKCFMMELDPHYCDVIIARWEKLTGKTAILEQ